MSDVGAVGAGGNVIEAAAKGLVAIGLIEVPRLVADVVCGAAGIDYKNKFKYLSIKYLISHLSSKTSVGALSTFDHKCNLLGFRSQETLIRLAM